MNIKKIYAILAVMVLLIPTTAFAEGFGVYEWSSGGVSMAENYMFSEGDPAILSYNPAAITRFSGPAISFGSTYIDCKTKNTFYNQGPLNMGQPNEWDNSYCPAGVPYGYYLNKTGDNSWFGVGVFCRFGNQIKYDSEWAGRYDTVYTGVRGATIQPTYGWKISPKLSAAVGLDINYMHLVMKKQIPPIPGLTSSDTRFELDGIDVRLGGVASLMYDINDNTSASITYRSRIKHTMDPDIELDYQKYTKAHGGVTLPNSVALGLGHKFNDGKTRIEFDAIWTNWKTYDSLNICFDKPLKGILKETKSVKNWSDAWRLGVGIEHKVNDKWSVMGGYVWDQSPVPNETMDFTVPTGHRHRISCGVKHATTDHSEWVLGGSVITSGSRDVDSHLPGAYNGYDYSKAEIHDGVTYLVTFGYIYRF